MDYFKQESERLRYRKLTVDDIPPWINFFQNNPNLPLLGLDLTKKKEALAEEWVLMQLDRYKTQGLGHLAAELKDSGTFIGMGCVIPRDLEGRKEYEIAYSLLPDFWGKGYGTELAGNMKNFALKNIKSDRFISIIDIRNKGSIIVAKKNGMKVLFRTAYLGMTVDVYGLDVKRKPH